MNAETAPRTRRQIAADGAITVIAESGMRGLTHRAIDARAGLPAGSTSSCFRTRAALIDAVVTRIAELDQALIATLPDGWWREPRRARIALTDLLEAMLGPARQRTHARMVLYLDAPAARDSRDRYATESLRFLDQVADGMAETGMASPRETARWFITQLDGILFAALARPFYGSCDRSWLWEAVGAVLATPPATVETD